MILFILCFQNLSKQTKNPNEQKRKKKRERKRFVFIFFPQRSKELVFLVFFFFLIHFLLQTSVQGLMYRKCFAGWLWRGLVWEEQEAEHRAQAQPGFTAQHRARLAVQEPKDGQTMASMENCHTDGSGASSLPSLQGCPPWGVPAQPGSLLTIKQRRGLLDGLRDLLQAGGGRALGSTSTKG